METIDIDSRIRGILKDHGRLSKKILALPEDVDLQREGMTSHATVNVMLALELEFDIEFPDQMLTRNVFNSISSIRTALEELIPA
jgi:acyl carrier protein